MTITLKVDRSKGLGIFSFLFLLFKQYNQKIGIMTTYENIIRKLFSNKEF